MAIENDVVLIHFEGKPTGFARIEDISPDVKKDWYNVTLLLLQIPMQTITWTLKDIYIDGEEFTMNGNRVRLELVEHTTASIPVRNDDSPEDETPPEEDSGSPDEESAKVISLADRKPS